MSSKAELRALCASIEDVRYESIFSRAFTSRFLFVKTKDRFRVTECSRSERPLNRAPEILIVG